MPVGHQTFIGLLQTGKGSWHVIERFERQFITEALSRHLGNISKAAEGMGMYRQHLQLKLADYGIDAEQFRRRGER
jgi:DNA-binding NtrC family response regulator